MKQRNFVAKHAQRSGAGRHNRKERKMSYIGQEDWIHIDSYQEEVEDLENKIEDLQAALKSAEEDEVYFLSKLIELRWRYSDYEDVRQELTYLIKLHTKLNRQKALQALEKEFPNRTIESWGVNV